MWCVFNTITIVIEHRTVSKFTSPVNQTRGFLQHHMIKIESLNEGLSFSWFRFKCQVCSVIMDRDSHSADSGSNATAQWLWTGTLIQLTLVQMPLLSDYGPGLSFSWLRFKCNWDAHQRCSMANRRSVWICRKICDIDIEPITLKMSSVSRGPCCSSLKKDIMLVQCLAFEDKVGNGNYGSNCDR